MISPRERFKLTFYESLEVKNFNLNQMRYERTLPHHPKNSKAAHA